MDKFDIYYGKEIEKPKGIIQIIHGMGEHCGRYENLGLFFQKHGYVVLGKNLKYHGKDADNKKELGRCNGDFYNLIDSQIIVTKNIVEKYGDIPLFVLGHSMGSFITQGYMKKNTLNISGFIIQGSSYKDFILWNSGKFISKIVNIFFKERKVGFFKKIIFLGYNNKFKNEKDEFSWLTKDKISRDSFLEDKYCNFSYYSEFYVEFFKFINSLYRKTEFKNIDKNTKILFIAGNDDPVGGYGKRVKKLKNFYIENSFKNVKLELLDKVRHEPHNEVLIEREKYFNKLLQWIEKKV